MRRIIARSLLSVIVGMSGLVVLPAAAGAAPVPPPTSMAAAGDSFTFGFAQGAGTCPGFSPCPEFSWSTGTAVTSHYQRLLALEPGLAGNATNGAVPGSRMSNLLGQVNGFAASQPDYVTVLLGGGDICFGPVSTATFAAQFRAGMDALFAASPDSRVLVSSIWSFESLRAAVLAGNPSATWSFCGTFMNATPTARAALTDQIVQYNAALAAECATYANCRFDGNALFDHVWTPAEVSTVDNFHPSVAGEQMISDVLWAAGYEWGTGALPMPASKDACKRNGWQQHVDDQGRPFANQGDCVSFVATKGKNAAKG